MLVLLRFAHKRRVVLATNSRRGNISSATITAEARMSNVAMKSSVVLIACLCLTACITQREHVLAPVAHGVVINAETGKPVDGALVRYAELEGAKPFRTGPDGRFTLDGRTDKRTTVALPVSGVFRDRTPVLVSAPAMADGYASAAFINRGRPAQALYNVTVLLFPADAEKTPLHGLMRDCIEGPEQDHALHLAGYAAGIDPRSSPDWLDQDAAEALYEHLRYAVPSSSLLSCEQMTIAYEMLRTQTEPIRTFGQSSLSE